MDGPSELWRMRRQFGSQLAAACFMTFVLCLSSRHPSRFQICRSTGQIAMTELIPSLSSQMPIFATSDVVPFRLTPNMQNFLGPICTEGILTSGILAIARSLTEPEVSTLSSDVVISLNSFPVCLGTTTMSFRQRWGHFMDVDATAPLGSRRCCFPPRGCC